MESIEKTRVPLRDLPTATSATVAEYRRTFVALKEQVIRVKEMTQKYPVFLVVAGSGYRFESPAHVDQFIAMLQREIERYSASPTGEASPAS